jgi:PAS domain S-box-containing protein
MKKTSINKISLKVLFLGDSPHDAEITRELLIDAGYDLTMDCVEKEKAYVSLLRESSYDLILSDFRLSGFDAFGALHSAVEICPDVPFICISESIGEETAIKLIKQGAADYILKDRIARLPLAIQQALDEAKEKKSRQQVEETLRESEERYRLLLNSNMDGILLTSSSGEIFSANPAACRMFNRSEEEICSLGRKCIVDESDSRLTEAFEERSKTGTFSGELTLLRKDGTKFSAEVSTVLFKNKKGAGRSSMVIRDVTGRKHVEEALRNNQQKLVEVNRMLQLVMDTIPVRIFWKDKDLVYLGSNRLFAEDAGRKSPAELIGDNDYNMGWHEQAEAYRNDDMKVIRSGMAKLAYEEPQTTPDGKQIWLRTSKIPLLNIENQIVGILGIYEDITERKRVEEAIRESEERFRMVFENVFDGICIYDEDPDPAKRKLIECNERYAAMAGRSREELLHLDNTQALRVTNDDRSNVNRLESLAKGTAFHGSFSWIRPDGKDNIVEYVGVPITWRGKSYSIGIDRDITEKRRAEEALREREQLFRGLFNASPEAIVLINPHHPTISWPILDCNVAACQMNGYKREELIGRSIDILNTIVASPDERIAYLENLRQEGVVHMETSHRHKDGHTFPVEVSTSIVTVGGHEMVLGIDRDITERKQAAEALSRSEERYRLLYEDAPIGILLANRSGQILEVNPAALQILGSPSAEETKKINILTFPLLNESGISAAFQRCIETGQPGLDEYPYVSKWGKPIYMHLRYVPILDNQNQVTLVHLIIEDVTEHQQAAEALRAKDENYRQLFDASPDGFILIGPDGRIVRANIAMAQMFRYDSPDALIGVHPPQFVAPSSRGYSEQILRRRLQGEDIHHVEYELVRKDGTTFYGETLATILRDKSGTVTGYICITRDTTERRRAEETLQASEAQYRSLFENANEAIFIIEPFSEKILEANSRSWEMYGFTKEEFIGMSLKSITKDVSRGESIIRETLETLQLKDFETTHTRKDGTLLHLLVNASVIRYDEQPAILCISRDITERIQAEERRQKLERDLYQAQRIESIGELASGIAHDFNNILNIMLGNASILLQSDMEPQKVKKGLDTIIRSINRGIALVRQILTFARKTDVEYGVVDINASVKEVAEMMSETFPKSIILSLHLKDEIPSIILDGDQFHQAILNLCINARDAMPKGGALRIATDIHTGKSLRNAYPEATEDSYVCVTVKDTGTGISAEVRRHIFEPFFTTKEREKGTGLGLAVVYGIVRSHQGFIDVESEVGKGTTFFLYLPAKEVRQRERGPGESVDEKPMRGDETILVVEDEEDMLELLADVLETNGYHVLPAKDGEEAIRISRQNENRIDLVLCDVQLPKISGRETCRQIKQLNPKVKIIFASGFLDSALKRDLIEAGASDFVQKPCSPSLILKKIRKVLS